MDIVRYTSINLKCSCFVHRLIYVALESGFNVQNVAARALNAFTVNKSRIGCKLWFSNPLLFILAVTRKSRQPWEQVRS
jgi:hypothetical protein